MFCPQCGQAVPEHTITRGADTPSAAEQVCPKCQARLPHHRQVTELPAWARFLVQPVVFGGILLLVLLLVAGLSLYAWLQTRLPDPRHTVTSFYEAIEARDKDALRTLLLPEDRSLGLGFCLNLLTQPTVTSEFQDVQTKVVNNKNGTAQLRSTGQVKRELDGRKFEIGFNDLFELQAVNRTWYIRNESLTTLSLCGDL